MTDTNSLLLAGDIGGTKTLLGLYDPAHGPQRPLVQARYPSTEYGSLAEVVLAFLKDHPARVARASFGVAGPVRDGQARLTNLPWEVSRQRLQEVLGGIRVTLLNDLEAIAAGTPSLPPSGLHVLNTGVRVEGGNIAVIAPGTGLGEAFLTWKEGYQAHASEGGHADFAPVNELQVGLLTYLQQQVGHVSYERVCSGTGIPNIYAYLKESGYAPEPAWLGDRLEAVADPTPVIVSAAMDGEKDCALCTATLETFVSILGSEAGNFALRVLAEGGVFLGGGIPPRIIPALERGTFLEAFTAKGRLGASLARIPVSVITYPDAALFGAACYGLELARSQV